MPPTARHSHRPLPPRHGSTTSAQPSRDTPCPPALRGFCGGRRELWRAHRRRLQVRGLRVATRHPLTRSNSHSRSRGLRCPRSSVEAGGAARKSTPTGRTAEAWRRGGCARPGGHLAVSESLVSVSPCRGVRPSPRRYWYSVAVLSGRALRA